MYRKNTTKNQLLVFILKNTFNDVQHIYHIYNHQLTKILLTMIVNPKNYDVIKEVLLDITVHNLYGLSKTEALDRTINNVIHEELIEDLSILTYYECFYKYPSLFLSTIWSLLYGKGNYSASDKFYEIQLEELVKEEVQSPLLKYYKNAVNKNIMKIRSLKTYDKTDLADALFMYIRMINMNPKPQCINFDYENNTEYRNNRAYS